MAEWNLYIRCRGEIAVDSGDGLTFTLWGYDGQASPAPVVYVNGVEQLTGYTFNNGSQSVHCSITFTSSQTGNVVTCDYRWKYECPDGEEPSEFEVDRDINIRKAKDINGLDLLAISYSPVGNYRGALMFEYMDEVFADMVRTIAERAYLFDYEYVSGAYRPHARTKLQMMTYPKYVPEPGVPDMSNVMFEFLQVDY